MSVWEHEFHVNSIVNVSPGVIAVNMTEVGGAHDTLTLIENTHYTFLTGAPNFVRGDNYDITIAPAVQYTLSDFEQSQGGNVLSSVSPATAVSLTFGGTDLSWGSSPGSLFTVGIAFVSAPVP